jgi:hypothetical protein
VLKGLSGIGVRAKPSRSHLNASCSTGVYPMNSSPPLDLSLLRSAPPNALEIWAREIERRRIDAERADAARNADDRSAADRQQGGFGQAPMPSAIGRLPEH